ncbi:MAG: hypothetical protein AB7N29_23420 [Vicinamibacterales bacterium]
MSRHVAADRRVAAVIKASVVFGLFDRALGGVWRAASSSEVAATAAAAASAWRGLDAGVRRQAVGSMVIAAVAAHVLFTLLTQVPPGWLWLVAPGMAGAIGALLVLASRLPGATTN